MAHRNAGALMVATAGEVKTRAVQGIAWTVAMGLGTRVLQMVGTLALTHFLQKEVVGEVANAALVAMTAHVLTTFGLPHYLVNRKADGATAWHATLLLGISGVIVFLLALSLQTPLAIWLNSPALGRYLPLLVVSSMLSRIAMVPERVLHQRLRFREASRARAVGEISYTIASMALAIAGAGGMAIVFGNLARSVVWLVALSLAVRPTEWARPHPFDRRLVREMLAYGLPLGGAVLLTFSARNWDNAIVSAMFGPAVVGAYSLAYNLADIPASQIGEQVGDVLTPSLGRLDDAGRRSGLLRATALLCLLVFPLAIGLGLTGPTMAAALMGPSWAPVGPMITVLAVLSVVRPVGWTIGSYLQITGRTRTVMALAGLRLAALLLAAYGLGRSFGPLGACAGVGVAFTLHAAASVAFVVHRDHIPASSLLGAAARPLLACLPLTLAVLVARLALGALGPRARGVDLVVEIAAGALGYAAGALLFASKLTRDLLRLVKELRPKRAAAVENGGTGNGAASKA